MAKKYSGVHKIRMVINALKSRPMTVNQVAEITGFHYETSRKILNDLMKAQVVDRIVHNPKNIVYKINDEHRKRTIPTSPDGSESLLKSTVDRANAPVGTIGHIFYRHIMYSFIAAKRKHLGFDVEADVRTAKRDIDFKIRELQEQILILEFIRDDSLLWNTTAMETWPSDPDWPKYEGLIPNE